MHARSKDAFEDVHRFYAGPRFRLREGRFTGELRTRWQQEFRFDPGPTASRQTWRTKLEASVNTGDGFAPYGSWEIFTRVADSPDAPAIFAHKWRAVVGLEYGFDAQSFQFFYALEARFSKDRQSHIFGVSYHWSF